LPGIPRRDCVLARPIPKKRPKFAKFSVIFPESRDLKADRRERQTAPTTNQSGVCPGCAIQRSLAVSAKPRWTSTNIGRCAKIEAIDRQPPPALMLTSNRTATLHGRLRAADFRSLPAGVYSQVIELTIEY
jgi:hypothetical protein